MNYNYHTHTCRCKHATGTDEEYILTAIKNGIKFMGFSEHSPFVFPDGYEAGFRVPLLEADNYISDIKKLRDKYKNQIDIKIGFEMEYYPLYFTKMLEIACNVGAEYLILGQHYNNGENTLEKRALEPSNSEEKLKEYVNRVVEGMKNGVFSYVAHPDVFNFTGQKSIYETEMRKICVTSRKYNIPLEINFLGIREKRNYPDETFWRIAGEEKAPVTFGFDAHEPKYAFDGESYIVAKKMVKKYKLNYIGKPKIIMLNKMDKL